MNEKYYGNYRGFVLHNQDKSHSGRVKVWVPAVNGRNFDLTPNGDSVIGGLNQQEVDDWKYKLPWAVTAQSLVGGGGGVEEYNGTRFQVGDGVQFSGGTINVGSKGKVDKEELRAFINKEIKGSSLVGAIPQDGAKFNIDGSSESWANFFVTLAARESSYNTGTVGDLNRSDIPQGSHGLFQLSPDDALNYKFQDTPYTLSQLQDPVINTKSTIKIAEKLLSRDNIIAGGSSKGLSRYWGPLRRGEVSVPPVPPYTPTTPTNAAPLTPNGVVTEPVVTDRTQKAGEAFAPSYHNFRVTSDTRDQMGGSSNVIKKGRPISLDFNSAGGGAGIMIVAPSDITEFEKELCEQYIQGVSDFFAQHSTNPKSKKINSNPIRIKGRDNERGIKGFFHTEPFDEDEAAMSAIRKHPQQYASVIASTLGKIPNALIFTPHSQKDGGAAFDGTNERDFALEYIVPYLASADNTLVVDAYSSIGNTHPEQLRETNFLKSIEIPQTDIDAIVKVGKELYTLKRKNKSTVGGGDTIAVQKLEDDRAEIWSNLPIEDDGYKAQKTQYLSRYDLDYTDVPMVSKVNPASLSFGSNNYSNVTKGSFVIPDVGAKVWVFFEGGDIDSPVVFANNPSTQDYAGIYDISSEAPNYPVEKKDEEEVVVRNQYVMNNRGGSLEFVGTTGNERLKLTSFHGSSFEMNKLGMTEFVAGNKTRLINADSFSTVRGDDLTFVDLDQATVVKGDISEMCGDVRLNVETAQKMLDLHRPIHDKIRLFDLQRTDVSHPLDSSPLQKKSGENRPCENCNSDNEVPTVYSEPSTFTPATQSGGGTVEVLSKGKSGSEGRTVSKASCFNCGGTGISKTSAEGKFDRDPIKETINDDINIIAPKMSELENELGDGGHRTSYITKSQTIHIGPVINSLESIRVDPNGKRALIGQQPSSDGKAVVPIRVPVPHVETVATNGLAGGDYSMMVANKYNLMVGANGINMKTLGEYNIQGRILTLMAEQVNISSNNQVSVDGGKNLKLTGDSLTIAPRTQVIDGEEYKSLALDGTASVSNNMVVKGGMHVEGQFSTQHITAPLEYQETETTLSYSDLVGGTVIGTDSLGGPVTILPAGVPNATVSAHSHTFANAPMTLVPTNDDVRKNANDMSKAKPVMAQPVEHGKTRLKNYAPIRYWNPNLFELYEDCNDESGDVFKTNTESVIEDLLAGETPNITRASESRISVNVGDAECEMDR
jgi:hypothetical protein